MAKNFLDWIAAILVIIGGINWGLLGAFNLDIFDMILGSIPVLAKIVYILVGLSAIYMIFTINK